MVLPGDSLIVNESTASRTMPSISPCRPAHARPVDDVTGSVFTVVPIVADPESFLDASRPQPIDIQIAHLDTFPLCVVEHVATQGFYTHSSDEFDLVGAVDLLVWKRKSLA